MYAINHAATALLLKKKEPATPIWPLLISVQFVEVLWVAFNYLGIEHYSIVDGKLHLDYLPYSHSVLSGLVLAILSFFLIDRFFRNRKLAFLFAIGIMTHIVIDIIFHEKDIQLSPFSSTPVWGLGILTHPVLNFVLEFSYGIFCWWYYKGSKALLITISIFNVANLPVMLASGSSLEVFQHFPFLLPTVILFQIIITWYFVARFSRS